VRRGGRRRFRAATRTTLSSPLLLPRSSDLHFPIPPFPPLSPHAGAATAAVLIAAGVACGLDRLAFGRLLAASGAGLGLAHAARDFYRFAHELAVFERERLREAWELENFPEGERKEMVELYVSKGVSEADATAAIAALSRYPDFFVSLMMSEELRLAPPDGKPAHIALATLLGFWAFFVGPAAGVWALLHAGGIQPSELLSWSLPPSAAAEAAGDTTTLLGSIPPVVGLALLACLTYAAFSFARLATLPLQKASAAAHAGAVAAFVVAAAAAAAGAAAVPNGGR
jgi:hypothetical protein